jgi:predicted alpha/beta superfamily hydrolase
VGYDTPLRFEVNQRSLDYTPPVGGNGPVPDPGRPERFIGGADRFLAMLLGAIRLGAERDLRINTKRRYLWGHSYGGLFSLYTLFVRPGAFAGYAAISPSVWWGEGLLASLEEKAVWQVDRSLPLFIALGDSEQRSDSKAPPPTGPAPRTMEMIERLKRQPSLTIEVQVLEGLGHGATLAASLPLVFGWLDRQG